MLIPNFPNMSIFFIKNFMVSSKLLEPGLRGSLLKCIALVSLLSGTDGNLFICRHGSHLVFLLLYVDDIIHTRNNPAFTASMIQQLSSDFDLKDLGLLHYFLRLQIDYIDSGLFVHQTKYETDLSTSSS